MDQKMHHHGELGNPSHWRPNFVANQSLKNPTPFTKKSKLTKTVQRVIYLNKSMKPLSKNTTFCLQLAPHETKPRTNCFNNSSNSNNNDGDGELKSARNRTVVAAFVTVSAVKAPYADLMTAQFPYDGEAIQSADEAVVTELRSLLELKQAFFKRRIYSSPPHVTLLLAEIQEQQSQLRDFVRIWTVEEKVDKEDSGGGDDDDVDGG